MAIRIGASGGVPVRTPAARTVPRRTEPLRERPFPTLRELGCASCDISGPQSYGRPNAADVHRLEYRHAVDLFAKVPRAKPSDFVHSYDVKAGSHRRLPIDVERVTSRLLGSAAVLLDARKVAYLAHPQLGALEILPSSDSPLGRYAMEMKALGTRVFYDPGMLWSQDAVANHDLYHRMIRISHLAIETGVPGRPEKHEGVHAFFNSVFNRDGLYSSFNGWMVALPGRNLIGPGARYNERFSIEELMTEVVDAESDTADLDPLIITLLASEEMAPDQLGRLRGNLDLIKQRADRGGSHLARCLSTSMALMREGIRDVGASNFMLQSSQYFTFRAPNSPEVPRLVFRAENVAPGIHVEVTKFALASKLDPEKSKPGSPWFQEVVNMIVVDENNGAINDFSILDPAALVTFDAAFNSAAPNRSDPKLNDAFLAMTRRFAPARLEAFARIGDHRVAADAQLVTANTALLKMLDQGAPTASLRTGLEQLLEARERVRSTMDLDDSRTEPTLSSD